MITSSCAAEKTVAGGNTGGSGAFSTSGVQQRSAGSRIVSATVGGRSLSVYIPAVYDSVAKQGVGQGMMRFPVAYFYDGQDVFASLGAAQILDDYIATGRIKPIILVGVHSTTERTSETVAYNDAWIQANWGRYTPRAREFADFLTKQIVPTIDEQYLTDKRPEHRAIMGFSLGGLFAGWCALHYPETFGMASCFSPSFWVSDEAFFQDAATSPKPPQRLRFDIGATTGEWNYYVPLIGILKQRGLKYGENLIYYESPNGRHDAASWRERLPDALLMFAGKYSQTPLQDSILTWRVETEVIASASTAGRFFLRLNPIVTLQSGLRYSLATEAAYTLLNPNDGALASDGRFQFSGTNDLRVEIRYKHLSTQVTISYADVQRRMGK